MGPERVSVTIAGVSGYTGGELLRLLGGHGGVRITGLGGKESAGRPIAEVHGHLAASAIAGERVRPVGDLPAADVAILALPRGRSAETAPSLLEAGSRVIDLSGDFRLGPDEYPPWYGFEHPDPAWLGKAAYGLPELLREQIRDAQLVANPGCFPTPTILALAPLLGAGLIEPDGLTIHGTTGLSGAGKAAAEPASHAASEESLRPYRLPLHQHTPEIERWLAAAAGVRPTVTFAPVLVPAVRGVLVTCFARASEGTTAELLVERLATAYAAEPFVRVLPPGGMVDTKRVRGSNVVELQAAVDERTGTAIVIGAVDNLVKGAAGQAVQNLNLMIGADETTALATTGLYP